jgi:hypothetical protein
MTIAITEDRWAIAQKLEHEFWTGADRTALARELDEWYAGLLDLNAETVAGLSVLDIGGGPMPIAALLQLPVGELTVVDPLPFPVDGSDIYCRVQMAAEDYNGPLCDEVWGYNVLQHVMDPAAVLETAKRHARSVIRWFDWTDTPLADHHPHSLKADWLIEQFDGWSVRQSRGSKTVHGLTQNYIALVAER